MDEARVIERLVELHAGQERLGPGSDATTRQALALCTELPARPKVLDIGCGTGSQTATLLHATAGDVTAVDLFPSFLDELRKRLPSERLTLVEADMTDLPFTKRFDLIWSEGAIYNMGFREGLSYWKQFLSPGGYMAVTEQSWLTREPPAELHDFWSENYPSMGHVQDNVEIARALGYELVGEFKLPQDAWDAYYVPLKQALVALEAAHPGEPETAAVLEMTRREIALQRRYPNAASYVFYVLRT